MLLNLLFLVSSDAFSAQALESSRIVVLAPVLAEWSAEILGKDEALKQIVGVTEYSDYPVEFKKLDHVGPYPQLNVEKIAALKPTLVVASSEYNRADQLEKLRRLKLHVEVMPAEKFGEMEAWIKKLGSVLGAEKGADQAAVKWAEGVGRLKSPVSNSKVKPVRAMIQIQESPIIAVGGESFLNEAFALIGYENIYSDLKQAYPKVSRESVLKEDPEVIFVMNLAGGSEGDAEFKKTSEAWKKFSSLKAVQKKRILAISADDYARCSLRLLNALKQLH